MADSVVQKWNAIGEMKCGIFFWDNCYLQKYALQTTLEFAQNDKLISGLL